MGDPEDRALDRGRYLCLKERLSSRVKKSCAIGCVLLLTRTFLLPPIPWAFASCGQTRIAAGLTDGLATMLFGMYMAAVEDAAAVSAEPAEVYLSYFSNVVGWSVVGVICSFLMNKCKAAFEEQLDNGVVVEYKEVARGEDVATVENGQLVTKPIGTGTELEDASPNFACSGRSLSLSVGRSLTAVLKSDMDT